MFLVGLRALIPVLTFLTAYAATTFAIAAWRRAQAKRRAARIRRQLGAPVEARALSSLPRDAVVVLEGVLRLGRESPGPLVSFHPYGVSLMEKVNVYARTRRTEPSWIELGSLRVALDPPLQVVLGAVETDAREDANVAASRLGVPSPIEDADSEAARGALRIVHDGDRVVVRGRIGIEASESVQGGKTAYRDPAIAYRLFPEQDEAWPARPIPVAVATAPRQARASLGPVLAGLAVASSLAALTHVSLRSRAAPDVHPEALPEARPACAAAVEKLLDANDPWTAAATPCDDPRSTARARWLLGEFKEASDAWLAARAREPALEPTVSEAQAHSLAGRPLPARDVVRSMSERWYRGPASPEKLGLECIANAFGRRGGDEAATRALDTTPWGIPECNTVAGDFGYRTPGPHAGLFDGEQFRGAGGGEFHDPYGVIQYPSTWFHLHPLALEASILRRLTAAKNGAPEAIEWVDDRLGYGHHAAELAAFLAIMGERERARGYLDLLDRIDAAEPPYPTNRDEYPDTVQEEAFRWAKVMAVAAGAAALLDDEARARRYLPRAEAHAKGVIEHHLALVHDGGLAPTFAPLGGSIWWPHEALFLAASRGDGAELAEKLVADRTTGRAVFAELLPRIHVHGEALRAWARAATPAPCSTCGLFAVAENAADRREIARLLGDAELEAKMAAIAQRYMEAILQRDGAPELSELERLYERISGARR